MKEETKCSVFFEDNPFLSNVWCPWNFILAQNVSYWLERNGSNFLHKKRTEEESKSWFLSKSHYFTVCLSVKNSHVIHPKYFGAWYDTVRILCPIQWNREVKGREKAFYLTASSSKRSSSFFLSFILSQKSHFRFGEVLLKVWRLQFVSWPEKGSSWLQDCFHLTANTSEESSLKSQSFQKCWERKLLKKWVKKHNVWFNLT